MDELNLKILRIRGNNYAYSSLRDQYDVRIINYSWTIKC